MYVSASGIAKSHMHSDPYDMYVVNLETYANGRYVDQKIGRRGARFTHCVVFLRCDRDVSKYLYLQKDDN